MAKPRTWTVQSLIPRPGQSTCSEPGSFVERVYTEPMPRHDYPVRVPDMEPLTARQAEILAWMVDYQEENLGCPPTIRDVMAHFGLASTNGPSDTFKALERKGWVVRRGHGKTHGVVPVRDPRGSKCAGCRQRGALVPVGLVFVCAPCLRSAKARSDSSG